MIKTLIAGMVVGEIAVHHYFGYWLTPDMWRDCAVYWYEIIKFVVR